jgi:hypothetical protein
VCRNLEEKAWNINVEASDIIYTNALEYYSQVHNATKRDINVLMRGTKDGEVIIKNIRPKTTGGTYEVIDQTFRDTASFKESEEGSISE